MQAVYYATLQAGQFMSGKPPCCKDMCWEPHLLGLQPGRLCKAGAEAKPHGAALLLSCLHQAAS